GGQKMTEHEKEFLRKNFPNSAEYKISLYAIFMDKGLQIVKPGGGLATYIVPDSFLLGRYFSKIRKFILRTSEIIYILLLPFSVFEATVGFSVVYLFQRKQVVNLDHQLTASFARRTEDVGGGDFKVLSYPQDYFNNQKFKRFRLFFDEKAMALISKFEKGSVEIGSVVRFSSGLISKTGQKNIISEEKKSDKWEPGIVSGSEIKHYAIIPDGYYILYDNQKIKSGYGNVDYFSNKIFMRQTGDSLVCAFDDRGLLALNNVHIGNKIGNDICLKFVTALLNSRALNFYYRTISLETDRVMAQTDIETIETLPVKSVTLQEQQPFIELVDKILAITKDDDYLENPIKQANVREYEKQIDQMVYQLYGLTEEEIAIIEDEKK
ncbi:MAG TPA: hypothetical protein DCX03_07590, partial [Bacteroidales bacterium]|nr:hypothetical protein [Bacteroidales bacterium]